ncbi:IclR family transcriptional regulator [Halosimplex litoreum]|uniref:IclR family transcriptional regulator n=1 Tax=Halosimplex litoreum TaxID=1198301 RepID=A0A7T3FVQ3_9EURY|nr:IclR family transcriptional regulator [Halosimplex litoreum]QPV61621.1 IclR family transcriptional regulator [Halosimplex litoreum]
MDTNDTESSAKRVQSTKKLFTIVDTLREAESAGVSELAERLGMAKSTVHVHLKTLEEEGYLVNDGGEYRLGLKFLEVGGEIQQRLNVFRAARPELDALAEEIGETTHLGIEETGERVLVYSSQPSDGVFDNSPLGHRTRMHWTALGKALLAELPEERVETILARQGLPDAAENTITEREELFAELGRIDETGYAVGDAEHRQGIKTIAMALHYDGSLDAPTAIGISGPKHRLEEKYQDDELADALQRTVNVIELKSKHY